MQLKRVLSLAQVIVICLLVSACAKKAQKRSDSGDKTFVTESADSDQGKKLEGESKTAKDEVVEIGNNQTNPDDTQIEPTEESACLFQKPLILGASVSAGLNLSDPSSLLSLMSALDANNPPAIGSNHGPMSLMAADLSDVVNKSEMFASRMPGAGMIYRQLDLLEEEDLDGVSVLASIDGFYWPTADEENCEDAVEGAKKVFDFAIDRGVDLVLATVPEDVEEDVEPSLVRFGVWNAPKKECVEKVNAFLRAECKETEDYACYLVDVHKALGEWKANGATVNGLQKTYRELRPDGVHLSPEGVQVVKQLVEEVIPADLLCPGG